MYQSFFERCDCVILVLFTFLFLFNISIYTICKSLKKSRSPCDGQRKVVESWIVEVRKQSLKPKKNERLTSSRQGMTKKQRRR